MPLYKSRKIRLEPNNKQLTLLRKHAGCARYAYNWAIAISERIYEEYKITITAIDLNKMFVKMEKSQHNWLYEVSKCATQQAIRNYETARKNFHRIQKDSGYTKKRLLNKRSEDGKKVYILEGLPQKKKKNKSRDSFYLENDGVKPIQTKKGYIKLPKIGWVRTSEDISPEVSFLSCTISRRADDWYVSYKYEFEPTEHRNIRTVGVDLGIKTLATLSTGITFDTPKRYKELNRRLRREQKSLSRKYESWKLHKNDQRPQSQNYKKQKTKIAKLHKRIVDHRLDGLHKLTTHLTKNHSEIVIEDLNIKGMLSNHNLARSIANGSFRELRRQLKYKGDWYGCRITVANRFFPSSKMCSVCEAINKTLKLKDREWDCEGCGTHHDRDNNACQTLEQYPTMHAYKYLPVSQTGYAESSTVKACGAGSSARVSHSLAISTKQEVNTKNPRE